MTADSVRPARTYSNGCKSPSHPNSGKATAEGKGVHREVVTGLPLRLSKNLKEASGKHQGLWFYTIGQRKGLGFGGGPWFVVKKNLKRNILFVSHGYDPEKVYKDHLRMTDFNFITKPFDNVPLTSDGTDGLPVTFKIRHTPEFVGGQISKDADGYWYLHADEKIHGVAPGQFCVIYDEHHHRCYGSGEII